MRTVLFTQNICCSFKGCGDVLGTVNFKICLSMLKTAGDKSTGLSCSISSNYGKHYR